MIIFKTTSSYIYRLFSLLIICLLIFISFINSTQAAIVSTHDLVIESSQVLDRENLQIILQRTDVQQQLIAMGVEPNSVFLRVDSMTNSEIESLNGLINQKPAGSGVIGLIGFILVVLLITDLLNLTNIYNF